MEYFTEQVRLVREDINDFRFTYEVKSPELMSTFKEYQGAGAIAKLVSHLIKPEILSEKMNQHETEAKIAELWMILQMQKKLAEQVNKEDIPVETKAYFISTLSYHFHSKIRPAFDKILIKNKQGDLSKLFTLVSEVEDFFPPESFKPS